ncbi:MAG: hypothetical protein ABIV13_04250 [Fimbriimonadales bacterium]
MEEVQPITGADKLSLTLTSYGTLDESVLNDPDSVFWEITIANNGSSAEWVMPIQPYNYHLEIKLPDGTVESLFNAPPIDYPMPNEKTLVRLYPRNSLSAIVAVKKNWRKQNASYRVIVNNFMELTVGGRPQLVPFRLESTWTLFK